MSEMDEPAPPVNPKDKPAAGKTDAPVRKELDDVLGTIQLQARIEQMEARLKARDEAEVASILESRFKDATEREVVSKVVIGKSLDEARRFIETIHELTNKRAPTPGAAIPAAVGGGEKPVGYFDDGYKHTFIDNRTK